jgi:hypothetical protein
MRIAQQRYDAAMQSLMAELTDEDLSAVIDRFEEATAV